jgi:hypothetical protein
MLDASAYPDPGIIKSFYLKNLRSAVDIPTPEVGATISRESNAIAVMKSCRRRTSSFLASITGATVPGSISISTVPARGGDTTLSTNWSRSMFRTADRGRGSKRIRIPASLCSSQPLVQRAKTKV